MAKNSRVPPAVGAIPVVGDLIKQADNQARWMQEMIEQNARLVGQLPATMKNFNDTLERFNETVARLDRLVSVVDVPAVRDIPDVLDALRREALPALRAAADTQRQVALLSATVERVIAVLSELPGAGILRRVAAGRPAPDGPTTVA